MDDVCGFHLAPYATHYVGEQIDGSKKMSATDFTQCYQSEEQFFLQVKILFTTVQLAKGWSAYYRKELKKFLCSLLRKLEGRNNSSNTSKSGLRFALCCLTCLCFQFCDHNYHLCTLQTLLPHLAARCTLGYTDYMVS